MGKNFIQELIDIIRNKKQIKIVENVVSVNYKKQEKVNFNDIEVWFVTGASSGIGKTLCEELLRQGYKVAAAARNMESLNYLQEVYSSNFLPVKTDVSNAAQVNEAIDSTLKHFSKIDVLVNNAGISSITPLEESNEQDEKYLFEVNFWGYLHTIKSILPHFRSKKKGLIYNVSSLCGIQAQKGSSIYAATKHAIEGISSALSNEIDSLGIDVVVIEPGLVKTNIVNNLRLNYPQINEYKIIFTDIIKNVEENLEYKIAETTPKDVAMKIIESATIKRRPKHLLIGKDANEIAQNYFNYRLKEIKEFEKF